MLWRALPLLDRYLFRELLKPFLWGMGAFSAIGVSAAVLFDLLRQVSEARLPVAIALAILALQLPYFISLSIPMAVLLTCLLTFSRLHTDRELMAMESAGMSTGRLLQASFCFSSLAFILMLGLTTAIVPASHYQAQQLLQQTVQQGNFDLQQHPIVYEDYDSHQKLRRLFYAQSSEGQTLYGLTVIDWTAPEDQQVISSESATWNPAEHTWTFKQGRIYAIPNNGANPYILEFAEQQLQLPHQSVILAEIDPNAMTFTIARQALEILRQQDAPAKLRALEIQIHRKVALPFTVLGFGLVGSVLGMSRRRLAVSNGFGLSLVLVLGQYLLIFIADAWGRLGWVSPWLGAWLPNLVISIFGVGLLVRRTSRVSLSDDRKSIKKHTA